MIDHDAFAIQGVRGPLKLDDVLFIARKASKFGAVQVVRDDRVCGEDHIVHAARLAQRAFDEGRSSADKPEVEFLRYLAGKRTIREAIDHMGLPGDVKTAIIIAFGPQREAGILYVMDQLGLDADDSLLVADEAHARAFGITDAQWEATTPERRVDLVLEAVAGTELR